MPGNNGKLRGFKGLVAESPAGFEFGNFLRRRRQMKKDLAMFSPCSEFWRPARDHALGVKKNALAALLPETFFPNPASFSQNQISRCGRKPTILFFSGCLAAHNRAAPFPKAESAGKNRRVFFRILQGGSCHLSKYLLYIFIKLRVSPLIPLAYSGAFLFCGNNLGFGK